LKEERVINS